MAAKSESGTALERLRDFGYAFNNAGELRKIDTATGKAGEEPFVFDVYEGDQVKNQEHYEKLAAQIPEIVYDLLQQHGLSRTYIPDGVAKERATFIFTYPQKLAKSKKLLMLMHGSGYVRAGQWARSLIINNSIDHGTQIPYIKRAKALGYDIVVTNTNDNYRLVDGSNKAINGLNCPMAHAVYVWKKFVVDSEAQQVAIVAHSYGGVIALGLAQRFPDFFREKVFAVALTDSAHISIPSKIKSVVGGKWCNWMSSTDPLDTEMEGSSDEMKLVSAGHPKHEWSSYAAYESVFTFLEQKYQEAGGQND